MTRISSEVIACSCIGVSSDPVRLLELTMAMAMVKFRIESLVMIEMIQQGLKNRPLLVSHRKLEGGYCMLLQVLQANSLGCNYSHFQLRSIKGAAELSVELSAP